MRILDVFMGIPTLLLAIAIAASLGAGIRNLILALIISQVPGFTRVVRSAVFNIVDMEYIEAAKAYGLSLIHILCRGLDTFLIHKGHLFQTCLFFVYIPLHPVNTI